ncbi:MAG: PD-(D/E)XK nuclease family transposase [Bacteroidia bacterium]|nr:PD-(D/E)XK nuclease family transposase [Bacteroidia bacterium]
MSDRFINLFTDYGFKRIFVEEPNKDILLGFLNELLGNEERITDLTYLKNERLGKNESERKAVFDLYCTNETGEKFIVEVQRVKQQFFKDRSVYYSTFAIQEQAARGKEWKYELKAVYTIAILDFTFDESDEDTFEHRVKLLNIRTYRIFYDKLTFIYLEIPKFNKELSEIKTDFEKWLFAFKNLHKLSDRPRELEEGIFKKLLELAEISRMTKKEQSVYHESLKDYWDLKSAMDTYFEEGIEEGIKRTAINALRKGLDIETIVELTELSAEQIEQLRSQLRKN